MKKPIKVLHFSLTYLRYSKICLWHWQLGRQPPSYFICTGTDPSLDRGLPKPGYGVIEACSLILHIFVYASVSKYKKSSGEQQTGTNTKKQLLPFRQIVLIRLYQYNNREDGVSDSNLFIQLILDTHLQCLYTSNSYSRLKHFELNINQCIC